MIYILGLIVSHVHKHKKRHKSHCLPWQQPRSQPDAGCGASGQQKGEDGAQQK